MRWWLRTGEGTMRGVLISVAVAAQRGRNIYAPARGHQFASRAILRASANPPNLIKSIDLPAPHALTAQNTASVPARRCSQTTTLPQDMVSAGHVDDKQNISLSASQKCPCTPQQSKGWAFRACPDRHARPGSQPLRSRDMLSQNEAPPPSPRVPTGRHSDSGVSPAAFRQSWGRRATGSPCRTPRGTTSAPPARSKPAASCLRQYRGCLRGCTLHVCPCAERACI
ncbi:hypothetical protein OH77DRAFT_829998 [Trametes cingulata]|nr:hypothetical protein OH77DRAFT_829998 [Trametes cingulata]